MDYSKFEIIEDGGGALVRVRNMADGDEFSVLRKRLKRYDGAWSLMTDRQYDLLMATRKRQAAKAAKTAESKIEVAA